MDQVNPVDGESGDEPVEPLRIPYAASLRPVRHVSPLRQSTADVTSKPWLRFLVAVALAIAWIAVSVRVLQGNLANLALFIVGVLVVVGGLAICLPPLVRHQRRGSTLKWGFYAGLVVTIAGLALCVFALVRLTGEAATHAAPTLTASKLLVPSLHRVERFSAPLVPQPEELGFERRP